MLALWKNGCRKESRTGRKTNQSKRKEKEDNSNLNINRLRNITTLLSQKLRILLKRSWMA